MSRLRFSWSQRHPVAVVTALALLLALTPAAVQKMPAQGSATVSEVVNIDFTTTPISSGTIANAGAQSTGSLSVVGSPAGAGTADGLTFANTSSGSEAQYLTGSLGSTVGITQLVIEMVAKFPDPGCAVQVSGSMVFALGNSNAYNVYRHSNFIGYNTFNADIFGVINTPEDLNTFRSYKFVMTPIPDLPSAQEIWIDGVKQDLDFRTTSSPTGSCSAITGTTENSAARVLTGTETFLLMTHSLGESSWRTSGTVKSLRITKTTGASTASAPTIGAITAGDESLSVAYTGSASNGGAEITNYDYSIDDGASWVTPATPSVTSPLVITGLTNGTTYPVKLRARNSAGPGAESTAVSGTPGVAASAPGAATISSITAGDTQLSVAFTAPTSNGGAPITNYDYSIDDGATWVTPSTPSTSSPLVITGLTNETSYQVKIRARNSVGGGTASIAVSGTPAPTPSSPPQNQDPAPPPAQNQGEVVAPEVTPTPESEPDEIAPKKPKKPKATPTAAPRFVSPPAPTPTPKPLVIGEGGSTLMPIFEPTKGSSTAKPKTQKALIRDVLSAPIAYVLSSESQLPKLPKLGSSDSMAVENGISSAVKLVITDELNGYSLSSAGWEVRLDVSDQVSTPIPLDEFGNVVLNEERLVQFSGTGFQPNSPVKVWLFSEPVRLADLTTDADGNFVGQAQLPEGIPTGEHTVQLNGLTKDGQLRSVSLGVVVQPDLVVPPLAPVGFDLTGLLNFLWLLAAGVLIWFFIVWRRRKKKEEEGEIPNNSGFEELPIFASEGFEPSQQFPNDSRRKIGPAAPPTRKRFGFKPKGV